MSPLATKISIGVLAVALGSGTFVFVSQRGSSIGNSGEIEASPPPPEIHSASWYVTHQDVMKADVATCQNNVAALPSADCQDANTAESQLYSAELSKAAEGTK
jgi:hypothetical protein